ncbi:MAG TPA: alpha-amylase/4-alpha-glucanotransferase domain-containing protein, partial [Longimicrobiales bacterium]|nr:alpha-amylase/4-alpha-glucanotransferase domain-containing protein [Longimicrobiales bacterium]
LASGPVGYVFGLHVHQPVGNFDAVFRSHTDDVYLPFLRRLAERGALPAALHVSGPLLDWLEAAAHPFLDLVGRLAAEGSLELLLSGYYEPVLPVLSRKDRAEQIGWMRERLRTRFGVEAQGLWLTERVWEPGLAEDLAGAGVGYVLVDDRHFLVTGFEPSELHQPWRTEAGGAGVSVLPIDERLRYLIPFRPATEVADYLRGLHEEGRALAILADDGEKFGGWPGTADWVWRQGWLDRYLETLDVLREEGTIALLSPSDALAAHPPSALAYLPSASYHEMEAWSLPTAAGRRHERVLALVAAIGEPGAEPLLRGGHWRNFLTRYSESNRMHKKAATLSALCRERGDPVEARRAIGRAQCNDAYWHGVFGGLYLRHLRAAVWANLAEAEGVLRDGEAVAAEIVDLDMDGADEVWIHGSACSALIAPARGGAVEELTLFAKRANLVDVLTRRRESYHREALGTGSPARGGPAGVATAGAVDEGMPSIHELEEELGFRELPPSDLDDRALFVDRVLPAGLALAAYERAEYAPLASWARTPMDVAVDVDVDRVVVTLAARGGPALDKLVTVAADGTVTVTYRWDASDFPPDARFAPELSMSEGADLTLWPEPEDVWRHEVRTVAKSERGAEESVQGVSVTPLWR